MSGETEAIHCGFEYYACGRKWVEPIRLPSRLHRVTAVRRGNIGRVEGLPNSPGRCCEVGSLAFMRSAAVPKRLSIDVTNFGADSGQGGACASPASCSRPP
jgi:hypothetical protein